MVRQWKKYLGGAVLLGTLVFLTGCGADPVVKVDSQKLYLPEFMYYVYQAEKDGQVYEEMYRNFFSESYWDTEYEEGKTFREVAKEDAYENGIMYTIFEKKAREAGYSLSEEEAAECEKEATEEYAGLSEKQRKAIGLSERELIDLKKKVTLGNKYYDALMEGLEVNEDKAVSGILEEEYIQHDVEYLYSEEEEVLKPYLERAMGGEEFEVMAEEKPEDLEAGSIGFLEGDYSLGEAFEKEALSLADGEVSEHIVKGEDGYYIIRMITNNSMESYQNACEEAIWEATNTAFQEAYEKIKEEFNIKKYNSEWDSLVIGELTVE